MKNLANRDLSLESMDELVQRTDARERLKMQQRREYRQELHYTPKKACLMGNLHAPGTPARAIYHDPNW